MFEVVGHARVNPWNM